jgi:hypothetical protein
MPSHGHCHFSFSFAFLGAPWALVRKRIVRGSQWCTHRSPFAPMQRHGGCRLSVLFASRHLCPFVGAGIVGVHFEAVVIIQAGVFVCGQSFIPRRHPTCLFHHCLCLSEVGWEEGGVGMLTKVQKRRISVVIHCLVATSLWRCGTWILHERCEWKRGELAHLGSRHLSPFVGAGILHFRFRAFVVVWVGILLCGLSWVVVSVGGRFVFASLGGMWHVSEGDKNEGGMGTLTDSTAPMGAVPSLVRCLLVGFVRGVAAVTWQ